MSDHGSVLGTVTDPSGAVVPGVSVTLTNVGTGNVFTAESDQDGQFTFQIVPVGQYDLRAGKQGFKKHVRSAFAVHAAEYVLSDVILSVGAVSPIDSARASTGYCVEKGISRLADAIATAECADGRGCITLCSREIARKAVQARWEKEMARKPANSNTCKTCSERGKKSDFLKTG